ncbi:unnamed protein product [Orchesella dallaii]|uniref:ethanolamine kinase n=1 Tax=Orchesella dallaii TaxID=48710 RepID=A0ABP1RKM0_9HEXA
MSAEIIPRISATVRENNFIEDSLEVIRVIRPQWIKERDNNGIEIKSKIFTDGITNKLIGFSLATNPKDVVVIKLYGANTELMINRQAEIDTMTLLHENKCGPQLYALFENGIAYEFIHGVTLTMETCRSSKVYPIVAAEMARVHKTIPLSPENGETKVKSAVWKKIQNFYELNEDILRTNTTLANRLKAEFGYTIEAIRSNVDELEQILNRQEIPLAFCHNDILLGNVIYNEEEEKVSFIDFEYAMPNYVTFDVANHFNEFAGIDNPDFSLCPDGAFRSEWISEYLKHFGTDGFTQDQFERWVEICIPASHLFWAIWAVVQAHNSTIDFDFAGYSGLRYVEYKKSIENVR